MNNIFASPLASLTIPNTSLGDCVFANSRSNALIGNKTAIIDSDTGDAFTYTKMEHEISMLAGGLAKLAGSDAPVIGLIAHNCPSFPIAFHAIVQMGAIATTVNPSYTETEIAKHLQDCRPTVVFTLVQCVDKVIAAGQGTGLKHIVLIAGESDYISRNNRNAAVTVHNWNDILSTPTSKKAINPHTTVAALPYSSGTGGEPKGVILTHRNMTANLIQSNGVLGLSDSDVGLAVVPFFHIYGLQVVMNNLLTVGATIVTMRRFEIRKALALIERHKITRLFAVPPIILALSEHSAVDEYDISSLRKVSCGAAALGAKLSKKTSKRIGCPVVQGYGMTELSPTSHWTAGDDIKPGSCGIQLPNTECRIVNPAGENLGTDETGELWVRGPQVMQGYLNKPKETSDCLDEHGWLRTGDLARIDSDGHIFIVGRLKELIKYNGFQVAPAELEEILISHPAISDAAVIGLPDPVSGERPKAFVKLKHQHTATQQDIKHFLASQVATYKRLHEVEFVDHIPKSASGKILRKLLKPCT